ncbi:hypothetical protein BZ163_05445 [Pseudomonas sp. VI4.1]|nr:hypothetical protein BZ163_05445 [Pseudomonas sp. VI4.1]
MRHAQARPLDDTLHTWMLAQRERIHEGTAISKALDHSLKRWTALVRCLDNGREVIDGF